MLFLFTEYSPGNKIVLSRNAKVDILLDNDEKFSLKPLVNVLSEITKTKVQFNSSCIGDEALMKKKSLEQGEILLLENKITKDESFHYKIDKNLDLASRNIPHVNVVTTAEINPVMLLKPHKVAITPAAFKKIEELI